MKRWLSVFFVVAAGAAGGCATTQSDYTMEPRGDRTMSGAGSLTTPTNLARTPDMGGIITGAGGPHGGGGRP